VCILENLREEEAWHRQISVPAAALKMCWRWQVNLCDWRTYRGRGGGARNYPDEARALDALRKTLGK
jgi:hypothetical protein